MDALLEPKPLYTIPEAAHSLAVGRTTIYELVAAGELVRVKIGTRAVITATSMRAFVERLEKATPSSPQGQATMAHGSAVWE